MTNEWPKTIVMSTELPYPEVPHLNNINGVNNALNHVLPLLKNAGKEILLYSPSSQKGFSLPGYPGEKVALGFPALFNEIKDEKKGIVVHAWAQALLGPWLLDWANANNIPSVASFNTNVPVYLESYTTLLPKTLSLLTKFAWFFYESIHNMADLNLAPSESIAVQMKEHHFKNVKTWGRGVDEKLFNPNKWNQEVRTKLTNGHPEKPIILYVGRLAKEKNLEVLDMVIKAQQQAEFVIVGDGPRRKYLETLLAYPNVHFTGSLVGEELAEIYASSDIFISPSLSEGFSNTFLEAFASGLPVIGFDASGMRELVKESGNGFLAAPNNWEELNQNISLLLANPELRSDYGSKGRKYALTMSWEKRFQELLEFYRSLREVSIQK